MRGKVNDILLSKIKPMIGSEYYLEKITKSLNDFKIYCRDVLNGCYCDTYCFEIIIKNKRYENNCYIFVDSTNKIKGVI